MATIQKRGRTYRVRVRIKGRPVQSATFSSMAEARKWARATEATIRAGKLVQKNPMDYTLGELIDRYIREILPRKRPSTIPNQTRELQWWKRHLGYCLLAEVKAPVIAECRERLAVSNSSINRYMAALSHAFTIAVKEWGWCDDNPCHKLSRLREPRGRVRYLADEERYRLLAACKTSRSPHLYTVVVLALSTGARKGELLGLTWRNVDLGRGVILFDDTKNGDRRALPLTGHALELMQQLPRLHTTMVFPGRDGGRADIERAWRLAVRRAGLKDFRFHDLRHTAASYLAMGGASLVEIAAILGHRSLEVTRRYAHLSEGHTRKVLDRMTDGLFRKGGKNN